MVLKKHISACAFYSIHLEDDLFRVIGAYVNAFTDFFWLGHDFLLPEDMPGVPIIKEPDQ
jgi:hypothetical protein